MEMTNIIAMTEQFKQAGGDMSVLLGNIQTLAATGKTSLGLNQWVKSDKPTMDDFNADNKLIDVEIRELQAKKVNVGSLEKYSFQFALQYQQSLATSSYYCKTPFEELKVVLHFEPTRGFINQGDTIGVLPEGFRPQSNLQFVGAVTGGSGEIQSTIFQINLDGKVQLIRMPGNEWSWGFLTANF